MPAKPKQRKVARRRRNSGLESAADLYEQFHGRPASKVTELREIVSERTEYAELGKLIQLIVDTGRGQFELPFAGKGVKLASSPNGRQLYFHGGDQSIDLDSLKLKADLQKDQVEIGRLVQVSYHTRKGFHDFEPIEYWHPLGEESGIRPLLAYDTLNRQMWAIGGNYQVKPEGIVD
ncbi:MAG: hypothetical protein IT160_07090 [Bryobacterales bacterium]|nr:hypothetical protein [Bryobacterales bacterium]